MSSLEIKIIDTAQSADPLDPDLIRSNILDHPEADYISHLVVRPYRKDAAIQKASFDTQCSAPFVNKLGFSEEILGCASCSRRLHVIIPETLQADSIHAISSCGQAIKVNVEWVKKELGGVHHYRRKAAVLTFLTPTMSGQQ